MKFKSYYWAIFAALGLVIVLVLVLPRVFSSGAASGDSPHGDQNAQQAYDYTPVIEAYQDLIKANPNDPVALEGLGDTYMNMGQYSDAKDVFEKANTINPNDALYHGRLGEAYYSLGMVDIALREFNNGITLDPNNQAILIDIGIIYSRTSKTDEARKMWQKAQDVDPNSQLSHTAKELIAQMDNPGGTSTAPPLEKQSP